MEVKIPGVAEKEERSGRPDIGIDRTKASDYYYHEQFKESFSSASYSKWDDDRAWSSQEWKTDTEMYERSGRPDETSWRATREIRLGFSHEETHYAQSVMNEGMPRDRPARPDIDSQEGARRSTSFRILCCALGRFSKTLNRTMHGDKDWDG